MSNTINNTNYNFPNQTSIYKGKVREVYNINNEIQLDNWRNSVLNSSHTKISAQSDNIFQFWVLPITHIVLRNPLSHLLSALHTELWGHID